MNWQSFIKWTNDNSGFLSFILFIATVLFGWFSGLFNSLIRKPKLKVRFIEKASFYCFFYTGNKYYHPNLKETFDLHQTGFSVYMSIANIGNMPTSIDKIYLGYYRNHKKGSLFGRQINWLPQWHTFDNFKIEYENATITIPPLRIRTEFFMDKDNDSLGVGRSIVGVAYFEQEESWGNYNPRTMNDEDGIKIIIKIKDVYGKNYKFKTTLESKSLDEAQRINSTFGIISTIIKK